MLSQIAVPRSKASLGARRPARMVAVKASDKAQGPVEKVGAFAAALSVALLLQAGTPDDALAASRTAGRAGGSSFSSARSSSAQQRAPPPAASSPNVTINTYTPSPFGFSPFGFSPFGFSPFGYGYGGGVVVAGPSFGLGTVFSFVFGLAFLSILFSALSGVLTSGKKKEDDDQW